LFDTKGIITNDNPKSPVSEAYRVLRTNILFSSFDKPIKTILVTSAGPGEGKSTTIANLAVTFAQQGSKVLLIDADLRKPRLHRLFGMDNSNGLTNLLSAHSDYRDYVRTSRINNLEVLFCGAIPPNPSELLMSNVMKQFIEQVKNDYDIILLDAPPAISVTDAAVISTYIDGTILVAASGEVERETLLRAKEVLNKVNANILGVVLNKINTKTSGRYHYYDYYYYYGDTDGKHKTKKHDKIIFVDPLKWTTRKQRKTSKEP
jgi:capsular exopolysaccharide synthesis family protein